MKKFKYLSILLISFLLAMPLLSCGQTSDTEDADVESEETEVVAYDEEAEDAVITRVEKDSSEFCGTWTTDSENGEYLYDSLTITLKNDGTWSGTITGEKLKGTWTEGSKCLKLTSDIFDCELAYTDTDKLILVESIDGDDLVTVLKKK